jgi:arsenite oxidase large subunit
MTFKRHIDRLPIIPTDAKEHNVTCQFCIVGCGYKAYSWGINEQGGASASDNKFGVDLSKQQLPMTPNWYSPSMYNIVKQDGKDVHLVIKPDPNCVVNSGLGSIRGARMAEESFSEARSTQQQRLTEPMVWRYGQMQPTSWDDALDLVARVTAAVIDAQGEDGLFVSAFDHGGAGGGYENTWGTGKLYFGAMKIKNIRIHNRPAYKTPRCMGPATWGSANSTTATRTLNSPTRLSLSAPIRSKRRPTISSITGSRIFREPPSIRKTSSCQTSRMPRPGLSSSIPGER